MIFLIFHFASLNTATPVTLIEAMASAKPVVATAVGGVPDIVIDGKTGLLVPSKDEEKMASAMIELLKDAKRRYEFGIQGREFVRERFSKERLFADMEKLYYEVMSSKHRGTETRRKNT